MPRRSAYQRARRGRAHSTPRTAVAEGLPSHERDTWLCISAQSSRLRALIFAFAVFLLGQMLLLS
jgi:hypothetical protein